MDNNLLSGLKSVGLENLANMDLFEAESQNTNDQGNVIKEAQKKESDFLFDKSFTCPVCEHTFKSKAVKTGKNKLLSVDMDLRPKYKDVDALKYDSIVCDKCGYAALTRYFTTVTEAQAKLISSKITPTFKGVDNDIEEYSYDDAVLRHQLALVSSVIKKGADSEKAYICLKLAWLIRGKQELLVKEEELNKAELESLENQEMEFIRKAYQGFSAAMSKERFPICGMDDMKYIYLCADLARRCEDFQTSSKLISEILVSKKVSPSLKEKTRELFELLKKSINNQ